MSHDDHDRHRSSSHSENGHGSSRKRHADRNDDRPHKRPWDDREEERRRELDPDFFRVRVLISGHEVGGIIGKNGSNIRQMQQESAARSFKILDAPKNCHERILVMGGSLDAVGKGLYVLAKWMEADFQKHSERDAHRDQRGKRPATVRMLIHQQHVGGIIGKGGSSLKALQKEADVAITVDAHPIGESTEQVVSIAGKSPLVSLLCVHSFLWGKGVRLDSHVAELILARSMQSRSSGCNCNRIPG